MKIENWFIEFHKYPGEAPECGTFQIRGRVYGHPEHYDGKLISTSAVKKVSGRIVTTYSGSIYKLGTIEPDYRKLLKKTKPEWDWRNPITMIQ